MKNKYTFIAIIQNAGGAARLQSRILKTTEMLKKGIKGK